MQTLNQKKKSKQNKFTLKKSHLCLIGSLLVIGGATLISSNYILKMKNEVFSLHQLQMTYEEESTEEIVSDIPTTEEVPSLKQEEQKKIPKPVDYSKYYGILEIPKISLKRGFYNIDSKYNNINYNVTLVKGSTMPDVTNGNLILMAHSGDAYISFFAYLYKVSVGDYAYVTYNGKTYTYQFVNIYNVAKNGSANIKRNKEKATMTLITCTKNSDTEQTIYIAELVW